MLALAAMWAYDLHLYTVAYFTRTPAQRPVRAARRRAGAARRPVRRRPAQPPAGRSSCRAPRPSSRSRWSRSSLYLIAMMLAARAMEIVGGDWARLGQVAIVFAMTLAALVLLPSAQAARLAAGRPSPSICSSIATIIARNGCASPTRSAAAAPRAPRSRSGSSRRSPISAARRAACCSPPTSSIG